MSPEMCRQICWTGPAQVGQQMSVSTDARWSPSAICAAAAVAVLYEQKVNALLKSLSFFPPYNNIRQESLMQS